MKLLLSIILCLFTGILYSQNTANGNPYGLSGVVKDSVTGDVIPYATVEVASNDTSCRAVGYTDSQGRFSITLPQCDSLTVKVGFTDYLPATRQITHSTLGVDTLTFYLTPGGKELGEVAVYGYRQFVKLMPSGFSYDIGKDLRSKSEDLLTAMRRVPMVVVDGEGKITVRGKTNFSIYLNGKPFNMANADPTQVLQSIPAANIAKIEMITNPDASYDTGAGTTIINIITTKGGIKGYSIRLTAGANTQPRANGDIIYNLVTDKLRLSATYNYFLDKHIKQPISVKREIYPQGDTPNTLTSTANNDGSNQYNTGRLMMEYDIDTVNMLYADGHILYKRGDLQTDWHHTLVGAGGIKSTRFTSTSYSNEATFETNIMYRRLHRKNKNEIFSLGYRFSYNPDNRHHESMSQTEALQPRYTKSISDGGLYQHTVMLDGLLYNKNSLVLKGGLFDIYRYSTAIPVYFTRNNPADYWTRTSGDIQTSQQYNNIGAYLTSSYRRGIFDFRLGARLEHVDDRVWQTSADNTTVHYTYIVPRASIVASPSDNTQLSLSYRYGIRRPSIWSMNPYETRNSEYDISAGNPNLVPQRSHNIGLEGMVFGNNYFINLSVDYENVRNPIYIRTEVSPHSSEILYSRYDNFGTYQNIGTSLFVNYRPTSFVRLNSFFNVGFCFFSEKDQPFSQQNFIYNITANVDFDISESLSAGAGCGYTQSTPDWRQYSSHTYYYSFYVKKTFCDKKLDVTLQINNPFNKYSRLKTDEWGDYFRQTRTNDITARSLGLRLSYQFGSGKRSEVKRNRNLKTDDLDISTGVD